ncbi:MAG: hypothetical protein PHS44_08200, partial [Candidatus Dojkabacteria bacterium]|nr:hypothetical protein [Candidatus Dojkabacteria bacterium]
MTDAQVNQQIEDVFHWINLSLDDFRKVLDAKYPERNGPNFLLGMVCLAVTELIAKLFWPYTSKKNPCNRYQVVRIRKYRTYKKHTFGDIDAKKSVI